MWDLPGPGLEAMSPALAGRFLTTAPPEKPLFVLCVCVTSLSGFGIRVMVASWNEFGSVPPSAVFCKSLRRIGVSSSLNV